MVYTTFPREIRIPRKLVVNNQEELIQFINKNYKTSSLYMSVYAFTKWDGKKADYNSAIVDKIYLDFDGYDKRREILKFSTVLIEKNIKHTIFFSGGGFHVYIYVNPKIKLNNKIQTLKNAQYYLIGKFDIHPDMQVVNSSPVARISRIINTYNFRRRKYCIPITRTDLAQPMEHIFKKSEKKQNPITIYGEKFFSIKKFDKDMPEFKPKIEMDDTIAGDISQIPLPPCIKKLIKKEMRWRERYLLITWLKENTISRTMCKGFLKQILSEKKYWHCVHFEKQVKDIYDKDGFFPKCETIDCEGKCPKNGHCEFSNYIYV